MGEVPLFMNSVWGRCMVAVPSAHAPSMAGLDAPVAACFSAPLPRIFDYDYD